MGFQPTTNRSRSGGNELRFAVHSPAQRLEGSPRCHRPPGGDLARRVHVRVGLVPAFEAPENSLALAVFRCAVPTGRTRLRRESGINLLNTSRRLLFKPGDQQTPSTHQNSTIKSGLLTNVLSRPFPSTLRRPRHPRHVKVFHSDQIEPTSEIGGRLLHPVLTSVSLSCPDDRDGGPYFGPAFRSARTSRKTTLQTTKPDPFVLGRGRRYRCSVTRTGHRLGYRGKCHMPPTRSILRDAVRLDLGGVDSGPPEPNPAHLRHPDPAEVAVQPSDMHGSDTHLSEPHIPSRFPPRRPAIGASEVVPHRLVKVSQRLLLHDRASAAQPGELCTPFSQLSRLFVVSRRPRAPRKPMGMLLHREVPHEPRVRTVHQQATFLRGRRQQPVAGHHDHDIRPHRQRRRRHGRTGPHRPYSNLVQGLHRSEYR